MASDEIDNLAQVNPAWCNEKHARTGLVINQDPDEPYDPDEPLTIASCCERPECVAKATKHVAGSTNRRADYYSDAERRAKRGA